MGSAEGSSLNPSAKRLAHHVEDHPLDYLDFEGRIEDGYGAGTVVVWDIGSFEDGHLKFVLHGEKLTGVFALTHTKLGGDEANWMLVKVDDEGADRRRKPTSTQNESVLSGKINRDFEEDGAS